LRGALSHITVPTLRIYVGKDVWAPLAVAGDLQAAISGSALVVRPGTGHACNIEALEAFRRAVRNFLRAQRS
jgi:pimeloyl-ACP methyl ester carboxylesterase